MRGKSRPPTEICADCSACDPSWASINRGVVVCDECSYVHRSLGRHVSQIKPLRRGPPWPRSQLEMLDALVNCGVNSIWEHSLLDPSQVRSGKRKPNAKDPTHPARSDFIKAKYGRLDFVHRLKDEDGASAKDFSKQLYSSVRTSNLETCLRLLSLGAEANFQHPEKKNTCLHHASKAGQMLQCELLIAYGADPGAIDGDGFTSADLARSEGHMELAKRLVECEYEVTDRLAFYLCGKKPDHTTSHFLIPEMKDSSLDRSELAESARRKLQALSDHLFKELATDVYDEVDRREIDNIWISKQTQSSGVLGDRTIPFLPLNPELSSTRNQGRQKLARFNAREFATLIVDILKEAKRRQQGTLSSKSSTESSNDGRGIPSVISDGDPIYDVVAEDDYQDLDQSQVESTAPVNQIVKDDNQSLGSADLSDGPITLEEYLEVKSKLTESENRVTQLLTMNKKMNQEIHVLQSMVQNLMEENSKLRSMQQSMVPVVQAEEKTPQGTESLGRSAPKGAGRPMSMYDSRYTSKLPWKQVGGKTPSTEELQEVMQNRPSLPSIDSHPSEDGVPNDRPASTAGSDYDNAQPNQEASSHDTPSVTVTPPTSATLPNPTSQVTDLSPVSEEPSDQVEEKGPTKDEIVAQMGSITKKIQELLAAAKDNQVEYYVPCSEKIFAAVKETVDLFPEKSKHENVRVPVRLLVSTANRLQMECKNMNIEGNKTEAITSQVINCAFDIAKAAKSLVTMYQ
ncbi:ARF GTPase-activating protein GIT2-like isoform X2 [Anneissia japonica]|uniref:ARF GTPase-activating protein GIT2-like isoform X2 n=1 Tax=Anneissia japonica TaxID=1529436 RepID=UPI0014257B48|nr:ARF GTPase-activating protein GIT2-like isoform X2 [Anneissia japonica]